MLRPIIKNFTYDYFIRRDGLRIKPFQKLLNGSQYYPADQLHEMQVSRLRELLIHCRDNNPFYRARFDNSEFNPETVRDLSELAGLPVLTKDDIREAGDKMFSVGYDRENTVHKRTGGSTAVPLHIYMNIEAASFKKAATLRHNAWANFVPGAKLAAVWGDTDKAVPLKERVRNLFTDRTFYLDTLKFDEEHIERFLKNIKADRPQILMGHAHSVFRLAEFVRDRGGTGDYRFEGIITSAMILSDAERKVIEDAFASPVFNRYGCEELSIIASECETHEGMHILTEGLYLEFEGNDAAVPRKLIITDLVNYAMPLIRYEIGDCAILQPGACRCGRTLPRLKEVTGRTAEFLYTPDKTPVFGISILDTFVIHIPGFKQVQIVQDVYDHLLFRIVKADLFSDDSLSRLKQNVIEIFGEKMTYDIEFVERIEQTERGKYRFSICNIDFDKPGH